VGGGSRVRFRSRNRHKAHVHTGNKGMGMGMGMGMEMGMELETSKRTELTCVLKMDWHIPPPVLLAGIITSYDPVIACVSVTAVSKRTDFLVSAQLRPEKVGMKILHRLGVLKANVRVAHYWLPYFTSNISCSGIFYNPHGASVVLVRGGRDALLTAAASPRNRMRMDMKSAVLVDELHHRSTRDRFVLR